MKNRENKKGISYDIAVRIPGGENQIFGFPTKEARDKFIQDLNDQFEYATTERSLDKNEDEERDQFIQDLKSIFLN